MGFQGFAEAQHGRNKEKLISQSLLENIQSAYFKSYCLRVRTYEITSSKPTFALYRDPRRRKKSERGIKLIRRNNG